jgi:lysophospholipase L1-like esterase
MLIIPLKFIFCLFFSYEVINPTPQSIYVVGDSLAQGLSLPLKQFAQDKKIKFHSRTIVGSTSIFWSKSYQFKNDLKTYSPDLIIVSLGTNDMKLSHAAQKEIEKISQQLINTGARIIWLVPPSMPFTDNGVRDVIYHLPSQINKLKCEDFSLERSKDKIHFTFKGYNDWAECIEKQI